MSDVPGSPASTNAATMPYTRIKPKVSPVRRLASHSGEIVITPFSGNVVPFTTISMKKGTIWPSAISSGASDVSASRLPELAGAA